MEELQAFAHNKMCVLWLLSSANGRRKWDGIATSELQIQSNTNCQRLYIWTIIVECLVLLCFA